METKKDRAKSWRKRKEIEKNEEIMRGGHMKRRSKNVHIMYIHTVHEVTYSLLTSTHGQECVLVAQDV